MSAQSWLREQNDLRRLLDSSHLNLDKMVGLERDGSREQYISCKREARRKLKQFAQRYPKLEKQLQTSQNLTDDESRRRTKELKKLGREYQQCKALLENKHNERGSSGRNNIVETHETMDRNNQQIKQTHLDRRKEQDEDLEDILKGVKRIKNITYDINTELERQDVIIDEVGDNMDTAANNVHTNVKRVEFLNKKSKDKGGCCLMTIL
eukprot:437192_1